MSFDGILKLMLAFRHDQEANVYVGFCPNLNIYSQGATEQEAEKALDSAISLFIKNGGLNKLLEQKGFNKMEFLVGGRRANSVPIENFNSVGTADLQFQLGRGETCQPCH